jgi:recombination protein RecT
MIQLAIRSGNYKKINVLEIKQGELIGFDPLNEEITVNLIKDPAERESQPTVGYYAMFEYMNGFRKAMYWTREQMMRHADKYSKAFSASEFEKLQRGEIAQKDLWKYSSFWYTSFDDMAKKTMIRQLISHWGVMSAEMIDAFEADDNAMKFDGNDIIPDITDPTTMITEPDTIVSENEAPENIDIGEL